MIVRMNLGYVDILLGDDKGPKRLVLDIMTSTTKMGSRMPREIITRTFPKPLVRQGPGRQLATHSNQNLKLSPVRASKPVSLKELGPERTTSP
jgi:hypothetical protein